MFRGKTSLLARRKFLAPTGAAASVLAACAPAAQTPPPVYVPVTPTLRSPDKFESEAALTRLTTGNMRFVAQQMQFPDQNAERRAQVAQTRSPFAGVLCCADSCAPPEVILGQGLGEVFAVRVAGNILSDTLLGSIESAVEHFQPPLILVLEHKCCGAMSTTVDAVENGTQAPGHMTSLVEAARRQTGDVLDTAIRLNVPNVLKQLCTIASILEEKLGCAALKLAGGYHDLDTGAVEFMG